MASTATVQSTYFGNLRVTYGNWSSSVGDAALTIGVAGGRVWAVLFNENLSTGSVQSKPVPWSYSTSGSVSTVTIYNQSASSAGTFLIVHS